MADAMKDLVEALCSEACAGRAPGTPGGAAARALVLDALRGAGLDPWEQPVPGCGGANVLARVAGDVDRWVIVAAHYDHLGTQRGRIYPGADDNAAAVAILAAVARGLAAARPGGRGVLVAAFDGEEPPYFLTPAMGSEHYARHPDVPLDRVDMMVCMDLVGHALGPAGLPDGVRDTVFALGGERSAGTGALLDGVRDAEPGVVVRRADAEVIPPLSDYAAFWSREVPFLLLTNGRSRHYHTPGDAPATLDWRKMAATARWLERYVRATCARPEARVAYREVRDDASTLRAFADVTAMLADRSPEAAMGRNMAAALLRRCDARGALPEGDREHVAALVGMLESGLA